MERQVLVLGIGNTLLSDDGIGVHVVEALRRREREGTAMPLVLRDGGTLGLSLLPEIERCTALVLIDAVELGAPPGEVRSFEGTAMDALLAGRKRSPHAVGIADLMEAARLTGCQPARRALIAVQPGSLDWGTEPTEAVAVSVPRACSAVLSIIARWCHDA